MTSGSRNARSSRTCRVVVVDDHAIVRDGLCAILGGEPGIEVTGTADDAKSAVAAVGRLKPDTVIMDLSMPRTDGADAIRAIKQKHPNVRVVVLTFHKEDARIHSALEAGADAYVLKDDGREDLLAALRNVHAGRGYLSPAICDRVISGYVRGARPTSPGSMPAWTGLSTREREVLKLVAEGYKTREIANYLSLSQKTVEKHRTNMMRKLGLYGVSAVTAYAIENHLLSR
jgi:DNA-binding NarL/FixJ family response regulator